MPQRYLICICFFALLLSPRFALADAPIIDGLGGAGRSGIPQESIFLNPAAIGILQAPIAFFNYTKSPIHDFNASGRDLSVGVYDTTNTFAHAGLAYGRESRATVVNGAQSYADDTTIRFGLARQLMDGVEIGVTPRYVDYRQPGSETKFVTGDAGILFNLMAEIRAGLTLENVVQQGAERPLTLAGGANYGLGYGLALYGDYGSAMRGPLQNKKLWALGAELGLFNNFVVRGGLYRDTIIGQRGMGLGMSWSGPRLGFDLAMKSTYFAPIERDISLGINLQI